MKVHEIKLKYIDSLGVIHMLCRVSKIVDNTIRPYWVTDCNNELSTHKLLNTFGEYEFRGELDSYCKEHNLTLTLVR
jgi:hypothetical protein